MTKAGILVVEDESIVSLDIQHMLMTVGYGIAGTAETAQEAIKKAEDLSPDIVLMDVTLKGPMDGIYAAEEIRSRCDVPVIYLTAHTDETTMQRAKHTEPYGYILKPFEVTEAMATIEIALYRHAMDKKLKESEELNRERLEELVAERTAELLKTNRDLQAEIVQRKRAEEALSEREKKFRDLSNELKTILDATPDSIILLSPDFRIVWANKNTGSIIPGENSDWTGRHCYELFHNLDSMPASCAARKALGTGEPEDYRTTNMNGKNLDIRVVPIKDENGVVQSILHIGRDVTEKIKLQDAAHLTTLGEMAAGVAHEINNPNNVIMFNASILSDAWNDIAKIITEYEKEHGGFSVGGLTHTDLIEIMPNLISAISKGSLRIKNIVDDMRRLSRQDKHSPDSAVDINTVIQNAVSLLNIRIVKHTKKFRLDAGADIPLVKGNGAQIEQVVINLLMNALQSLPDNERAVTLSSSFDNSNGQIIIQVTDEGCGIPGDIIGSIKQPFFSTKHEGTGLGLSLSDKIITRHGGDLRFESEPGKGTTVTLSLPAILQSEASAGVAE